MGNASPDPPPAGSRDLPRSLERFLDSQGAVFVAFLVLVLALKLWAVHQPPVWDGAASVFPAAIYLSENDFDLPALLASPGFAQGGPNSHALSIVTFLTALVYRLTDDPAEAFLVLHTVHFALAALAMLAFYRLGKDTLGAPLAFLLSLGLLLLPIFRVQAGYMYLEIPLLLCALLAVDQFRRGRPAIAFPWVLLAVFIKQAGVVLAVALAVAALLERRAWRRRALACAVFLAPAVLLGALEMLVVSPSAGTYSFATFYGAPLLQAALTVALCAAQDIPRYLLMVPDVAVAIAATLVIGALRIRPLLAGLAHADPRERTRAQDADKTTGLCMLYVLCFLGFFYVAIPASGLGCATLPRYYVMIAPFLAFALADTAVRFFSARSVSLAAVVVIGLFAANGAGALYPADTAKGTPGNNFAVTERSEAYRHLLELQRRALETMQRLPDDVPVVYALPIHYLAQYPNLGYVKHELANGVSVYPDLGFLANPTESYPDCFVMFHSSRFLGGGAMLQAFEHLRSLPQWRAEVAAALQSGPYVAHFLKVHRREAPCLDGFEFAP